MGTVWFLLYGPKANMKALRAHHMMQGGVNIFVPETSDWVAYRAEHNPENRVETTWTSYHPTYAPLSCEALAFHLKIPQVAWMDGGDKGLIHHMMKLMMNLKKQRLGSTGGSEVDMVCYELVVVDDLRKTSRFDSSSPHGPYKLSVHTDVTVNIPGETA